MKDHLGSSPKVIETYAIFDPLLLPPSDDDIFKEYGDAEVKILSNHFFFLRRRSCFASGLKSSFFSLEENCKSQLEARAAPSSCPFLKTKAFPIPLSLRSYCLWLKSGFVYPAAMPGQREEVVS